VTVSGRLEKAGGCDGMSRRNCLEISGGAIDRLSSSPLFATRYDNSGLDACRDRVIHGFSRARRPVDPGIEVNREDTCELI